MKKILTVCILLNSIVVHSQENYEIQVYASPTMTKGNTIFELHSNFTFNGEKNIVKGVIPSNHSLHETLEITHGITEDFEIGFYLFTNYTSPYGYKVVGTHIRPRIKAPDRWKWPLGASLSVEMGLQSEDYSTDTRSIEIRPIIDKQFKNFYISLNPVFGIGLKGVNENHTPSFTPNIKASYTIKKIALGFEYYGDIGQINEVPDITQQGHSLFLAADLYLDPKWEINFGPGFGLTEATDKFIFKLLVGRRINWKAQK